MKSKDVLSLLVIGAIIFFWEDIYKLVTPKEKKVEWKNFEIEGTTQTMDEYCQYVIYKPMAFESLHSDATLMKNYCYRGDSGYWDDKPHETGHIYAQEQAKKFEEKQKEESKIADELKSITIILRNTTSQAMDTTISDASDQTVVFPPPLAVPIAIAASNVTVSGFTANWIATNANGYYLDVATDSAFSSFVAGYQNLDVGNVSSENISGLSRLVTYYYRVRAYYTAGTSGNSITIETITGTVIIGTQTWTSFNLNDNIIGSRVYNDDEANRAIYGGLYAYSMIATIEALYPGYHVPSMPEFNTLLTFLGGNPGAGGKLKETGTTHWNFPNTGALDSYGFGGLPGGALSTFGFVNLHTGGYILVNHFLSQTETAWLANNNSNLHLFSYIDATGMASVRLIKD
jgi:uncharacterized protein (TIGR02145 family)